MRLTGTAVILSSLALLALGLGPVQDFAAGAQRTRERSIRRPASRASRADENAFQTRLMRLSRIKTAAGKNGLAEGLSRLSGGTYNATELQGLAEELAESVRGARLSEQQAASLTASLRDTLAGESPHSAQSRLQESLGGAGVSKERVASIRERLGSLVESAPRLSEQQKANLQKLRADLAAIQSGSTITREQVERLASSLKAMVEGANRPSPESVDKLASDLSSALADRQLNRLERAQLTLDLYAVLNSASIPYSEFEAALEDFLSILAASGVTREEIRTIRIDLEAIYAEFRKTRP